MIVTPGRIDCYAAVRDDDKKILLRLFRLDQAEAREVGEDVPVIVGGNGIEVAVTKADVLRHVVLGCPDIRRYRRVMCL